MNPATRRAGGLHYTSLENIHKIIDPLFLDDFKRDHQPQAPLLPVAGGRNSCSLEVHAPCDEVGGGLPRGTARWCA